MSDIERRMDKLGRIVLPKSFVKKLKITTTDNLSISLKESSIIITPTQKSCAVCGNKLDIEGKIPLCSKCLSIAREN